MSAKTQTIQDKQRNVIFAFSQGNGTHKYETTKELNNSNNNNNNNITVIIKNNNSNSCVKDTDYNLYLPALDQNNSRKSC